ncbi:hypothetical protein GT347_18445 [Xylophilus rhododendri]|uniref:Pentatricopeptide repeat-containing protein n=1 Tax=Xylophilus rhododendri TaxID=2697032 RepID=A0A857J7F7_9BURK|nr:hypothetical protein [Xylophilus rhododendri]QHI99786.1 hypothetical protein GT347_18445 [Xylophilus rhododendri]
MHRASFHHGPIAPLLPPALPGPMQAAPWPLLPEAPPWLLQLAIQPCPEPPSFDMWGPRYVPDLRVALPLSPRTAPNAGAVNAFNHGRMQRSRLLHITGNAMLNCGRDGVAALSCLMALSGSRDFWTGQMVPPNRFVFKAALMACMHAHLDAAAMQVFNAMLLHGFFPTMECHHAAMQACIKARNLADAEGLFCFLLAHGPANGLHPNAKTYRIVVEACGLAGRIELAMGWMQHMQDHRVAPDPAFYRAMLVACRRCGERGLALSLFKRFRLAGPALGAPPDRCLYFTALLACPPWAASELLRYGVEDRIFTPSLGLDAAHNRLHLHCRAALMPQWQGPQQRDLPGSVGNAIIRVLLRQGRFNDFTRIVASPRGTEFFTRMAQEGLRRRGMQRAGAIAPARATA